MIKKINHLEFYIEKIIGSNDIIDVYLFQNGKKEELLWSGGSWASFEKQIRENIKNPLGKLVKNRIPGFYITNPKYISNGIDISFVYCSGYTKGNYYINPAENIWYKLNWNCLGVSGKDPENIFYSQDKPDHLPDLPRNIYKR